MDNSKTLALGKAFLGKHVRVVIDRPLGSHHPTDGFHYDLNYGYLPGVPAPDGEDLDAYLIGPTGPVAESEGLCIAVVHRLYEDDDKLVVVENGEQLSDERIKELVWFQEGDRPYTIVRSAAGQD
jgi:inorganic pyrophosphatase